MAARRARRSGTFPPAKPARVKELSRLAERLNALSQRVAEAEARRLLTARDKEAAKGRLAAILRRPEYQQPGERGGALRRLLDQFLRWLSDLFPKAEPFRPGTSRGLSTAAQIFVIALALAVIGFILWKFRDRLFREGRLVSSSKKGGPGGARRARRAEETAADLLGEAERLARRGETRGAFARPTSRCSASCATGKSFASRGTKQSRLPRRRAPSQASQNLYHAIKPLTSTSSATGTGLSRRPRRTGKNLRWEFGVWGLESEIYLMCDSFSACFAKRQHKARACSGAERWVKANNEISSPCNGRQRCAVRPDGELITRCRPPTRAWIIDDCLTQRSAGGFTLSLYSGRLLRRLSNKKKSYTLCES